jgi:hypothetical protein
MADYEKTVSSGTNLGLAVGVGVGLFWIGLGAWLAGLVAPGDDGFGGGETGQGLAALTFGLLGVYLGVLSAYSGVYSWRRRRHAESNPSLTPPPVLTKKQKKALKKRKKELIGVLQMGEAMKRGAIWARLMVGGWGLLLVAAGVTFAVEHPGFWNVLLAVVALLIGGGLAWWAKDAGKPDSEESTVAGLEHAPPGGI